MPTLTIDLTAQQATRVAAAMGSWKPIVGSDPPAMEWVPATMQEARAKVIAFMKEEVRRYEREQAAKAADNSPLDVT